MGHQVGYCSDGHWRLSVSTAEPGLICELAISRRSNALRSIKPRDSLTLRCLLRVERSGLLRLDWQKDIDVRPAQLLGQCPNNPVAILGALPVTAMVQGCRRLIAGVSPGRSLGAGGRNGTKSAPDPKNRGKMAIFGIQ